MEGDPTQMLLPVFTKALSRRLNDDSISVREAALSLAGSYVVRSPEVASAFHSSIQTRLTDSGVSVRKRAVKIFEAIIGANPNYSKRAGVFDIMLQRAADPKEEDGVRDLIESFFCRLWIENEGVRSPRSAFSPGSPSLTMSPTPTPSAVVAAAPITPPTIKPTIESVSNETCQAYSVAQQMVEVVRSAGSTEHLEYLLKLFLGDTADRNKDRKESERVKRKEMGQRQCEQIAKALFELLLVSQEKEDPEYSVGENMISTLQTISLFSELSPDCVFHSIDTLLPYLKADNGVSQDEEVQVVASVCRVISRLPPSFSQQLTDRLAQTKAGEDMKKIAYSLGPDALDSTIQAFSRLAKTPDSPFSKKLLDLSKTFYSFLCKRNSIQNFASADVS